jgi:hypothetical protein
MGIPLQSWSNQLWTTIQPGIYTPRLGHKLFQHITSMARPTMDSVNTASRCPHSTPQALLFRPSVLRALPIRQASREPTSDKCAERIESARFGPFRHLWPDATSVSRRSIVFRHLYRRRHSERVFTIFKDWLAMVEN